MGELMNIRGKDLYVGTFGEEDSPPLLYIHGGPGIGSYDFEVFQKDRLSGQLRLITVDQRGVLRSESLLEDEDFKLTDIVEDCEALRISLGLKRWSVLGHSFGGYMALLYYAAYPDSIEKIIFESPTFDLGLSARSLLWGAAEQYLQTEEEEQALICMEASQDERSSEQLFDICFNQILPQLGDRRENLYTYGPDKLFFDRLVSESPFPNEWWSKQALFLKKLFDEGAIYQSIISMLRSVECPALLIKGAHDYVTCERHVSTFMKEVKDYRFKFFEHSGHMPRYEEPERYAETVTRFVLGNL
ncbi:alpha/beta fold hydrolase [Paenibacillus eucommiae]|uniref:Proline iminopeptidase n=1 Tax=Paenibacillus eucommiae TaxID=1355755 RepID=A0ABS4J3S3_9BACL|nr:alpha/beta hydrolase [Paenibacillus eucommiae]MBP1994455.1 proline iminopeptidase [Paenibacillus eucommiae]